MKNFIRILLIFVVIFNSACKEKAEQATSQESIPQENIYDQLIISFNFKTNKADVFKIMMNNIEVDELQKKNIHVFEDVTPTSKEDRIIAKFDANNMSKDILLHLGGKIEKEVTIKSILISYGNQQFNLTSPEDFNSHLVFNKFIERDSTSNKFITKRIEGILYPIIRIKNNLINQLQS